jgi:hypothetical protein
MSTPIPAHPVPTPKRSRRRWVLLGGFVLFVVSIVAGYILIAGWLRDRELEQLYAEIDADDPNWRWPDLVAELKPAPDEENAFVQIRKVHGMLQLTAFALPPVWDSDAKAKAHRVRNARLSVENAELLRAAFQPLDPQLLSKARKLKDLPKGRLKIDPNSKCLPWMPEEMQVRNIFRLLECDVMLRLHENDLEGVTVSWHALLNTSHAIEDNPTAISQLIRMLGQMIAVRALERILGQGELSESDLAKIQTLLERELGDNLLYFAMRGERAGGHQTYLDLRDGKTTITQVLGGGTGLDPLFDLYPGFILKSYPAHLRHFQEAIKVSKLKDEKRLDGLDAVEQRMLMDRNMIANVLMQMSVTSKVARASHRNQALLRSAQVAVAAERYRLKSEAWPRGMDELIREGLLEQIPNDPYDGKPLRFQRTPTGLVIYSMGPDKADNQGKLDRDGPGRPGSDLGFELWDRPFRAVAPPEEEEP